MQVDLYNGHKTRGWLGWLVVKVCIDESIIKIYPVIALCNASVNGQLHNISSQ